MSKSNFLATVTPETCTACGLCTKRCPIDAIQLKFSTKATNKFRKAASVDEDLCIGCGVCVHKCKKKAVILKQKQEITTPPKTVLELMTSIGLSALETKAQQLRLQKAVVPVKALAKVGLALYEKRPEATENVVRKMMNAVSKRARKY